MVSSSEKKWNVMLIDDDKDLLDFVSMQLEGAGIHTDCYQDPEEALENFSAGKYHLVISDLAMKPFNGDELCRRLLKIDPRQKILLITGTDCVDLDISEGLFDSALLKPFDKESLLTMVRSLIEENPSLRKTT